MVSWGGTYGACTTAVHRCQAQGLSVGHVHLRYLNPFPRNLGDVLRNYKRCWFPNSTSANSACCFAVTYLVDAVGFNKIKGKPFAVGELVEQNPERTRNQSAESHEH